MSCLVDAFTETFIKSAIPNSVLRYAPMVISIYIRCIL